MGATNTTPHYSLPQFVNNDKPTWLGDVNGAMSAIDTAVYGVSQTATNASTIATAASSAVDTMQASVTAIDGRLTTAETELNDAIGDIAGAEADILVLQGKEATSAKVTSDEVVTVTSTGWVASATDPRYPWANTVVASIKHNKPQAYGYGGGALIASNVQSIVDTIEQFLYDDANDTITFYSTSAEAPSVSVDLLIRG